MYSHVLHQHPELKFMANMKRRLNSPVGLKPPKLNLRGRSKIRFTINSVVDLECSNALSHIFEGCHSKLKVVEYHTPFQRFAS